MELDFLKARREKIVRTTLYGDQEFTTWELELLHTPIMQRLYNLKQLGFADRIYPDAVHSRFNHILGVAEMAERMASRLVIWLRKSPSLPFEYADERTGTTAASWTICSLTAGELAKQITASMSVVRLIGLLHDITHAAFGHTLEDEVRIFVEKHDDPARQVRFYNALVAQLLYLWTLEAGVRSPDPDQLDALERLEVQADQVRQWAQEIAGTLSKESCTALAQHLRDLETTFTLLGYIEYLHESGQAGVPAPLDLMISSAIKELDNALPAADVVLHRDAFLVDIVGNTICADLLDYARRDALNAGLKVQFDDRLLRYICAVSVHGDLSPTGNPCIRTAIQFYTDKMRYDVLSEMSGVLKARYLITERVLFHPTKCAAGAMLGTAAQLLGIDKLPAWMQVLGDQEFIRLLIQLSQRMGSRAASTEDGSATKVANPRFSELIEACFSTLRNRSSDEQSMKRQIEGARVLLWKLISRRYPKLVYRLGAGIHHSHQENDESVAGKYTNPNERFKLERSIELRCNLPPGSVVVHCPRRKTGMKAAQALVVGADLGRVTYLRNVGSIDKEQLQPYNEEITAVENMYRAIWQLHVYLDSSQLHKAQIVETIAAELIHFPNDELLRKSETPDPENPYALLVGDLRDKFPQERLTRIIEQLDAEGIARMRHGIAEDARARAVRIIQKVEDEEVKRRSSNQSELFPSDKARG
jgi:HD superfamily phosphohydrolase